MASGQLHLVKLCVGVQSVEDLADWQKTVQARNKAAGRSTVTCHVTRMWPRRQEELLDGGSLYWVFKGLILGRQRIIGLAPRTGEDGIERCAIEFDPEIIRTEPQPRRAFQGWRYLTVEDAPLDIGAHVSDQNLLPPRLQAALSEIGVR